MEDIIDVDYIYAKRELKYFDNKNLGDYHDLHVQSDTLLLIDLFENLSFSIRTWTSTTSLFKQNRSKARFNFDMLLIVEKGIRGGICHAIHRYAKANNKYMKQG